MTDDSANRLIWELLSADFPEKEVKSFNQAKAGQPPRWLSYVEDETVMDRLDRNPALGPGRWAFTAEAVSPTVAKVTLKVLWPETGWVEYSDFGYPTNGERGEALKEAVSDGIRRVARMAGVARYIYAGEIEAHAPTQTPGRAHEPRGDWAAQAAAEVDRDAADDDSVCPKHGEKWMGSADSGRYHKNGVWEDTGKTRWCRHPGDDAAKKAAGRR